MNIWELEKIIQSKFSFENIRISKNKIKLNSREYYVRNLLRDLKDHGVNQYYSAESNQQVQNHGTKAISVGAHLEREVGKNTLIDVLENAALKHTSNGITFVRANSTEQFISYGDLLEKAKKVLGGIQKHGIKPGDRLIFQLQDNYNFIVAFWACILGGIVPASTAVPSDYNDKNADAIKIQNIFKYLDKPTIISEHTLIAPLKSFMGNDVTVLDLDKIIDSTEGIVNDSHPSDITLNLFTSGSTGIPKCVEHNHSSLVARTYATILHNGFNENDNLLNWMPLDHVGGIVMSHLLAVYLGCNQVIGEMNKVLENPITWIEWMSTYKTSITWAPNFAFSLIVNNYSKDIENGEWDLSNVRHILNGGEAVVLDVASQFTSLLSKYGLKENCIYPSFGMSETSSGIVYSNIDRSNNRGYNTIRKTSLFSKIEFIAEATEDTVTLAEVGQPIPGVSIRIVDRENNVLDERQIGRVQVSGPTLMQGYFKNDQLNKEVFIEGGWFNTGDLGFIHEGSLTITGRDKDVIIINGKNHQTYEIEEPINRLQEVKTTFVAACPISEANEEKLSIFYTPLDWDHDFVNEANKKIRKTISELMNLNPEYIIPVRQEEFPKTSFGKIQHSKLIAQFYNGDFLDIIEKMDRYEKKHTLKKWFFKPKWEIVNHDRNFGKYEYQNIIIFINSVDEKEIYLSNAPANINISFVEKGEKFQEIETNHFVINPASKADYLKFFSNDRNVDAVFYLWPIECEDKGNLLEGIVDETVAASYLLDSLNHVKRSKQVNVHIITKNAQLLENDTHPNLKSLTLESLVKTAIFDLPNINCRLIDIDEQNYEAINRIVFNESVNEYEKIVVFRGGERYIPIMECIENIEPNKNIFNKNGLYLITGGLGGVGKEICKFLLSEFNANLIIIGRKPLSITDENDCYVAQSIQELGKYAIESDQINYFNVTTLNADALNQMISNIENALNIKLDGILHLAGTYDEYLIGHAPKEEIKDLFEAKINGSIELYKVLKNRSKSVSYVTFSSTTTLLPGYQSSYYAAANRFQETFTQFVAAQGFNASCLVWSMWEGTGISQDKSHIKEVVKTRGHEVISKHDGIASFILAMSSDSTLTYIGLNELHDSILQMTNNQIVEKENIICYIPANTETEMPTFSSLKQEIQSYFPEAIISIKTVEDFDRDYEQIYKAEPFTLLQHQLQEIWEQVLGTKVGVYDHFIELGGNSIKAIQILSKINQQMNESISIHEIFTHSNIVELESLINSRINEERIDDIEIVGSGSSEIISIQQESQLFLQDIQSNTAAYNISFAIEIKGSLNVDHLKEAIIQLLNRHEILRTSYTLKGEKFVSFTKEIHDFEIPIISIDNEKVELEKEIIDQEIKQRIDLSECPIRVKLLSKSADEHTLLVTVHHIAFDGWSLGIFVDELNAIYGSLQFNKSLNLRSSLLQYKDFAAWERENENHHLLISKVDYWRDQLKDAPVPTDLPSIYPKKKLNPYVGSHEITYISSEQVNMLKQMCKRYNVSLYTLLLGIYLVQLQKYTQEKDLVIGTIASNRTNANFQNTIGFFANTLPLRIEVNSTETFEEFLNRLNSEVLTVFENQEIPFSRIMKETSLNGKNNVTEQVLKTLFIVQNNDLKKYKDSNMSWNTKLLRNSTSKFNFSMEVFDHGDHLELVVEYNSSIFNQNYILEFLKYYEGLMNKVINNPNTVIQDIALLENNMAFNSLSMGNQGTISYESIIDLFNTQVSMHPNRLALKHEDTEYTYAELKCRVDELAMYLRSFVKPKEVVGVMFDRSPEQIISFLAIL
ncbi:SDR family NAD(P)-dependent oxidoreductase, partial [Bacillus cereus]